MPSTFFSRLNAAFRSGAHKPILGLQNPVEFQLGRGRLFENSKVSDFALFSTVSDVGLFSEFTSNLARSDSTAVDKRGTLSIVGVLSRALAIPSVSAPCQVCVYHIDRQFLDPHRNSFGSRFQRKFMAVCGSLLGRTELGTPQLENLSLESGQPSNLVTRSDVSCINKSRDYCRKASMSLGNRELWGNSLVYGYYLFDVTRRSWKTNPFVAPGARDVHSSCSAPFSAGAAPNMSFDGSIREDQNDNPVVSSDQKVLGDRALKLFSGSCYLPHPDKEETGGEDAHFICIDEQAIGVADGVGGWADLGIDSGQYARELMSHSVNAIQEEPKGSIDPARVLEKAYLSTKSKGSSTACIVALTDQGLHAVNLGDSGFLVVREGCTIFRSPVQQHDFNFTYQLASGSESDPPSAGQIFTIPVAPGDVIIAGTDGLFDNLYNNEVTAVVVHAVRAGLGPQVTAQKIAALARQRAQDKDRQTPFSTAAQDAGYRYYGGKLDDITVVVSYITSSSTA
ncbi:probable protein phosphatase 2C 55 isoform X2 [Magnolia sinica]|uniref:probable protein phosphatase 2C 55 isoform X2 n=1 Tax=Magnolia sinica TaxID=86752 RepID=UPI00265A4FDA|nr:probable protein phosphatase 2C 55 isoform X2 [Magnolia sinica]